MKGESNIGIAAAIVGATGAVGRELIRILDQRDFPCDSLKLLASERSAGIRLAFRGEECAVAPLTPEAFQGVTLVFSSAGAAVSRSFVPWAIEAGAVVIDNTSAFRMEEGVPLVVPEVNADEINGHQGIIANPNCSTIQMVAALAPIHRAAGIARIVVSTYQAASGAGQAAMEELIEHTRLALEGRPTPAPAHFAHSPAFNCIPHIDVFLENGYTREEMKLVHETRKILNDPALAITATAVRVPALRCHSESVNLQTRKKISAGEVRELLERSPGVRVVDDPANAAYPLALDAAHRDETFVGRIREDDTVANGLSLWIVADQLRKGAALNAVQIGEELIRRGRLRPSEDRVPEAHRPHS
jgi:aspartate-semialdehyde dehydrogenase